MLERLVLPSWLRLSLALPLLVLNLWVLRQLLLPLAPFPALFLGAALIAFLLDLPTRWLVGRGLPRSLAVLLVVGLGMGLLVLAGLWLVPRLVQQLGELINALPSWLAEGQQWLDRLEQWAAQRGLPTEIGDLSSSLLTRVSQVASQVSQQLLGLLGATVGVTVNTVIVLVLAIFLLLGGESIVAGLARWLPAQWRGLILSTLGRTFRGYFAGQVLLALILSGAQMVVFTLLGIPYGVLFAVLIGFTTLVPYASALTIVLVSVLLALEEPRTGLEVLAAAISVGQVVDQVIQPRLMGSIVGLQPAWLLVCLPIGARFGSLMGLGDLLGLLLAVPVASCLKTLLDELARRWELPDAAQ
ncbi:AI-2E family transporter [Vulcanococcus limneticus Candia 3F8]|uniref:AI-2E family transporter n=1 Tax=Vulcanococcus limneticus TaxID=2170428 RepID=UPI0018E3F9CF|nr:AI-2E family transporter [Vulcanococcus limneticus]MCP9792107.1 AI-2E family transporter [Vulcanococcus limneticus MW73D5]MCP9893914.1 AI-2E family transporter [Vulcanococcus limneticus Candia 3F8]MCP9897479.1 AI-2E family transporter [Vulcanococcus limneticus Candia 3B3]